MSKSQNVEIRRKAVVSSLVSMPEAWRKACDWQALKAAVDGDGTALPEQLAALRRVEGHIVAGRNGMDALSWAERSKMVRHFRELCLTVGCLERETKELREYQTKG